MVAQHESIRTRHWKRLAIGLGRALIDPALLFPFNPEKRLSANAGSRLFLFYGDAMINIRLFEAGDWPAVWSILEPVFRSGETYAYPPEISRDEAYQAWIEYPLATFVAHEANGPILGTYFIKPNQPGLGAHVCNCGYVVAPTARGKGVASAMCIHSQHEAVARGFHAMQFNLVVSTNEQAIRAWKQQGFHIVGALPGAFRHRQLGYVDALVMYKTLQT